MFVICERYEDHLPRPARLFRSPWIVLAKV